MHQCHVCGRVLPDFEFYKGRIKRGNFICKECEKRRNNDYYHKDSITTQKKNKANFEHALGGYVIRILNHTKPFEHRFNIQPTEGEAWVTDDKEQFLKRLNELI